MVTISWSKAVSMAVIRTSSGVSVAAALWVFLLPFGRPGWRFAAEGFCFLAAALALLAAFSASLRTTCSMRIGNDRRFWTRTRDRVKKASPGTGLLYVSDHRGSNSQAVDFEGVEIYPIFAVKIENPGKSNT